MAKILIANRLTDGLVVFYAVDGNWVESIATGQMTFDDAAADRLLAAGLADEHSNRVIDPRLIDVTKTAGKLIPAVLREAIRAHGPTIAVDRTL
ncbi:MAG: DUF2849 domain-containing protein [Gammaproteobacteria bacterium]|jgi:hypothetical protein|nr:nitrite reductase [Chromatiales bacterium]MDP6674225.1 DUF2849 domain-containing protein [Gammaproteobacteria bacterium]